MGQLRDLLADWKSAATGGVLTFIVGAIFTFIVDIRTMSASELQSALDIARQDNAVLRTERDRIAVKYDRIDEAYDALAAAYWDEPVIGWLKSPDGRYIQANKRFIEQLVIAKNLDPNRVIGYNDYEIWGDSTLADTYRAHDLQVMESGHMIEFHEQMEISGSMVDFISRKYPAWSTHGKPIGVGGVAITVEDCD